LVWAYNNLVKVQQPEDTFDAVMREAAEMAPQPDTPCFIPYLAGERSPYWLDTIRGGFYGLQLAHERRHIIRAIQEGIAYSLRHLLDLYAELGVPVRELVLSGGGTKTPGLCQIIADVCGHDAAIYAEEETVTRVLYALYRLAFYGDDLDVTLNSTFPQPEIVVHNPQHQAVYDSGYGTYRRFAAFAATEAACIPNPPELRRAAK
jgi:xylulokinase